LQVLVCPASVRSQIFLNRRTEMKPRKKTILTMLLGLMLVASSAGMAQTPAQGDQKKKTEACCSMDSCCCCNGDSCPLNKDGAAGADAKHSCSGDSCQMKAKDSKNHADDHECCSCCGESCDMKHDATMKHGAKGDCCNAKNKKTATKKAA